MLVPNFNIADLMREVLDDFRKGIKSPSIDNLVSYQTMHPRKWKATIQWALNGDDQSVLLTLIAEYIASSLPA